MDYEAIIDVLIAGGYISETDRERAAWRLCASFPAEASGELAEIIKAADEVANHWRPTGNEAGFAINAANSERVLAYLKTLASRPAPAAEKALREAAQDVVSSAQSCYQKGKKTHYIEDENGELMYLVPFDDLERLRVLAHKAPKEAK